MEAAAMASGAIEPPEVGVAAGALVAGAEGGVATATGVGVAACCARTVASTVVSASVCESLDFESVGLVWSEVVVDDDWSVLLPVAPLAFAAEPGLALLLSDGELALAAPLESLFAGGDWLDVLLLA